MIMMMLIVIVKVECYHNNINTSSNSDHNRLGVYEV